MKRPDSDSGDTGERVYDSKDATRDPARCPSARAAPGGSRFGTASPKGGRDPRLRPRRSRSGDVIWARIVRGGIARIALRRILSRWARTARAGADSVALGSHGASRGGLRRVGLALRKPAPGSTVLGSVAADAMSDLRSALAPTRAIAAGSSSSRPEPVAEPAPPGEERRRCPTAGAVISRGADAPSSGWYCASGPETSPFFANAQISSRTRRWGRRVRLETSAFAESGVRRRPRADGDDSPGTGRRTRPGPDEHRSPSPGATARKVQDYSGENRLTGLHEKGSPV